MFMKHTVSVLCFILIGLGQEEQHALVPACETAPSAPPISGTGDDGDGLARCCLSMAHSNQVELSPLYQPCNGYCPKNGLINATSAEVCLPVLFMSNHYVTIKHRNCDHAKCQEHHKPHTVLFRP